jgi:hypothetical protein
VELQSVEAARYFTACLASLPSGRGAERDCVERTAGLVGESLARVSAAAAGAQPAYDARSPSLPAHRATAAQSFVASMTYMPVQEQVKFAVVKKIASVLGFAYTQRPATHGSVISSPILQETLDALRTSLALMKSASRQLKQGSTNAAFSMEQWLAQNAHFQAKCFSRDELLCNSSALRLIDGSCSASNNYRIATDQEHARVLQGVCTLYGLQLAAAVYFVDDEWLVSARNTAHTRNHRLHPASPSTDDELTAHRRLHLAMTALVLLCAERSGFGASKLVSLREHLRLPMVLEELHDDYTLAAQGEQSADLTADAEYAEYAQACGTSVRWLQCVFFLFQYDVGRNLLLVMDRSGSHYSERLELLACAFLFFVLRTAAAAAAAALSACIFFRVHDAASPR